jgi:3-dehydroquinate synthase
MHRDKKASAGKLRFILPDRIGRVELVGDVSDEDVLAAVEF